MGAKRVRWAPGCGDPGYYEAVAEAKELDSLSMLNMAWFYLDTLKDILAGVYTVPVRSTGKYSSGHPAKVLKKYGLVESKSRPFGSVRWILTDKGKAVYSELIQSPIPT